jgi:hypothetical protein
LKVVTIHEKKLTLFGLLRSVCYKAHDFFFFILPRHHTFHQLHDFLCKYHLCNSSNLWAPSCNKCKHSRTDPNRLPRSLSTHLLLTSLWLSTCKSFHTQKKSRLIARYFSGGGFWLRAIRVSVVVAIVAGRILPQKSLAASKLPFVHHFFSFQKFRVRVLSFLGDRNQNLNSPRSQSKKKENIDIASVALRNSFSI